MHWVDVCGPPGSGKSTLCDPMWGPHELPIENELPPAAWHDFLNEITRLFYLIGNHWSFQPAIRMNNRSIRKMATVARTHSHRVAKPMLTQRWWEVDSPEKPVQTETLDCYIQTGLVQRGLGFGWRMNEMKIDLNELRHYFRLMPVSIGVAVTRCPQEEVIRRNHARQKVKETAHENRDFMVPLMLPAIDIALETLNDRGVPIAEIDTTQPIEGAQRELQIFAGREPHNPEANGSGSQVQVLSAPPWWL